MSEIHPPSVSHDDAMQRLFAARPDFAAAYLENAAEGATDEEGITIFVVALRRVAKFRGLAVVAEKVGMTPESLSHELSGRADPTLRTLVGISQAIGMKLAVVPVEPPKPAPKKRKPAAKPKSPRKASV